MTTIDSIVEFATTRNKIFTNNESNIFSNIVFTTEIFPSSSEKSDAFENYYRKITETLIMDTQFSGDDTTIQLEKAYEMFKQQLEEAKKKYVETAWDMTSQSLININGITKYIDAVHNKIEEMPLTIPSIQDYYKGKVYGYIENCLQNNIELNIFMDSHRWAERINSFKNENTKTITDSGFQEIDNTKTSNIPQNNTISQSSTFHLPPIVQIHNSIDTLRQQLIPKMSHSDKAFYIIQLRNYLRILKRLWIMTTVRKGLVKEVTYANFKNNDFYLNQPFYKKMKLETKAKKIFDNMQLDKLKKHKIKFNNYLFL